MSNFLMFILVAVAASAIAAGLLTLIIGSLQKPITQRAPQQENYRAESAIGHSAVPGRG